MSVFAQTKHHEVLI